MANGPALSTAKRGEVYVGSEFRDSLTMLDILHANQFEGERYDPELERKAEENFYRGAPPNWFNLYVSEKAASDGTATPFIKRDGYEELEEQIDLRRECPLTSTIKLLHQQRCGGTTLAMQVMWDLRKTFRCAVLTGLTSDITKITNEVVAKVANEIVQLFTAGSRNDQNTVLLLVDHREKILENLQDSIITEITKQKIDAGYPVVILLKCVRSSDEVIHQKEGSYNQKEKVTRELKKYIILEKSLSDREQADFKKKKEELGRRFGDQCEQFHGFNILQSNFSEGYIRNACATLEHIERRNRPPNTQLVALLCLLNAYVPGSYLLESQCLDFVRHEGDHNLSLEDQMQPFSHLIITFQEDGRAEKYKKVRMAHTMIAQCCTKLFAKAGVTRSKTTRNLLNYFCRDLTHTWLLDFVKDMLTKREMKKEEDQDNSTEMKKEKEKFSRLIREITEGKDNEKKEGERQSVAILELASNTFGQISNFPQALARFYYKKLQNYNLAEKWAVEALKRDPQNSIVADTLGQVHKNHLMNNEFCEPREILQLAEKAIKAFEKAEKLDENEDGPEVREQGTTDISSFYNYNGKFGYLEVCNALYDKLVNKNETWKNVLTKKVSMGSVLKTLGDNKLLRFNKLIVSLRDKVKDKCIFFEKYRTYSKPNMGKDYLEFIFKYTSECYQKYVGDIAKEQLIQMFQEGNLDDQSVEVLSFLVKQYTQSELEDVTTKFREMCLSADSETALVNNILTLFRGKMPSSKKDPPELHMFTLLWYWPVNEGQCDYDLSELAQKMLKCYENTYKKYFQNRYLLPVFFIGKGEGVKRIVHRNVIEKHLEVRPDWSDNWKKEEIFQNSDVQKLLLRLDGEVRNYKVYTRVGGREIEINANLRNSLWKKHQVTFYLGFTIRGPVAFGIQNKTADTAGLLQTM
ncbi:sterile alpha motif domain-containing protein 9-like [Oreochromis aureus]|uniref:sterile alpha motif domain-containing protein 9-like n=1 Tax=Oreochromis aureus TaxID=47969 RepID=UPI001953FC19|nr:sterile alpha motif domain-containing protein 9-like [Oreochromis aureus]